MSNSDVLPVADDTTKPQHLVKVGVYCLRGNGHWACYDDPEAAMCGTKGPDVYIDVDFEDYGYYPEWLREAIDHEFPRGNQS